MRVPLTINMFLERAALVYGDRCAIVDEPGAAGSLGRITYGEFWDHAKSMAHGFDRMGLDRGARIAIISPNAAKFLISFFGVSGFGRVLVPINYRLDADEIVYILQHSAADVVLIDPEIDGKLAALKTPRRIILDGAQDADLLRGGNSPEPWRDADEDDLVSINYTSGTTARPKGVRLTHRNCWLNAVTFGWHLGISQDDVYLHTLPSFHANGWGLPYAFPSMGCKQVIVRKIDGEQILTRMEHEGVTVLAAAPIVVASILDAAGVRRQAGRAVPGAGIVRIVCAGAPPPQAVIQRIETELGWEFMQLYGLTETSPLVTFNRISRNQLQDPARRAERLVAAGPPAIGVDIKTDEEGRIFTRSNNVFEGYWNNQIETDAALKAGWFDTGDAGSMNGPMLSISDRMKDVIITGGENVSSIQVEDCIYQHPEVAEVCVIGVPDEHWGETILALVVKQPGSLLDEAGLLAYCRDHLAHFKCPRFIEIRNSLARTATGKLEKNKMRAPYWEGRQRKVN